MKSMLVWTRMAHMLCGCVVINTDMGEVVLPCESHQAPIFEMIRYESEASSDR